MKINFAEIGQFFVLFLILFVSSIIFTNLSSNWSRFLVISIDAVLYVFWGIWHHYSKDRFSKIILLEYSLVAFFIVVLAAVGLGIVRFL